MNFRRKLECYSVSIWFFTNRSIVWAQDLRISTSKLWRWSQHKSFCGTEHTSLSARTCTFGLLQGNVTSSPYLNSGSSEDWKYFKEIPEIQKETRRISEADEDASVTQLDEVILRWIHKHKVYKSDPINAGLEAVQKQFPSVIFRKTRERARIEIWEVKLPETIVWWSVSSK